ncbi:putative MFS family arabinose efflux permease [Hoeflea marina]|uniref:Putative MFS family arabinose efflux permease n=1 Tax=Hoeflea marina TaxID=274592 RepID=A0A317PNH0_9HYPH|nr:YbfB/YjiJ family MFS transporter [Hoeflea marina]PWW01779.1 putative MFS family arabinose efflux permease [Hoeflea marina]
MTSVPDSPASISPTPGPAGGPIAGPSMLPTAIAGAIAMAVAMGLGRFFYTPVLPAMMAGLNFGPSEAGWIAAWNYAGYLAGAVLAGYGWGEGIERKVALAALLVTAALLLAMGVSSDFVLISAIRFLAGVASAFVMVFTSSIVLSHGLASGRASVQSTHFGGVGSGIFLSALMFGLVMTAGGGWRTAWIVAAMLALAGLVAVGRLLPGDVARTGPPRKEPPIVWTRAMAALTLAYGIFGFGYIVTATFLVAIVRQSGGSSMFEAGVWLITGLSAAPSVALWAGLSRRIGLIPVFMIGCFIEALGVAASVLLPLPWGPVIGGILLGGTFVMATAYGLQAGRRFAPQSPRRVLAMMTAAFGTGQILGPVVAGYLTEWSGSFTLASLAAAAGLLTSVLILLPFRRA